MKRKKILIILLMSIILITISSSVQANLLSECNICKTSGKCTLCNGTKTDTCPQCNGTGKSKCNQCNNGYVSCHICNGSKIIACDCGGEPNCPNCSGTQKRTCPQCNGNGKLQCNSCKGVGTTNCNGCSGKGYENCQRCGGHGKCDSCKGTGYLSGNNNGVNNVPKNGDTVELLNGKTIIWGGSKSSNTKTEANSTKTQSSNQKTTSEKSNNQEQQENNENNYFISEDKSEINIGKNDQIANAFLNSNNMTEKEQEIIKNMPKEELEKIVQNLDTIISSVKLGEVSNESAETLKKVLEKNGHQNENDIKLCKLNFDGHISLDFPVKVSVNIDSNMFLEGDIIFTYHILEDGTVEFLGEAQGYADDGKVTRIEFSTKGFSDFFLTTEKLDLNLEEEPIVEITNQLQEQKEFNWMYVIIGAIIFVIILVIIIFIIKKSNKNKNIKKES